MRRIVVIALSVMLALVVAMPMVSGKPATTEQKPSPPGQLKKNLPDLTAEWWNWNFSTNPSPLEGEYSSTDPRCQGEYVEGVFFLSGSLATDPVTRTCTVPAHMPILFSPFNYLCSEVFPTDPVPLDTACATPTTDATIDPPSRFYARVDGKDAKQRRIASGLFQWTIPDFPEDNFLDIPPGTYEAAQDGLWVYLKNGLKKGNHKIVFGGTFKETPLGDFEGARITYKLTAVKKARR